MSTIAAIVLAAGRSSRMAPCNKLLEPVGGEPLVRRVAGVVLESGARPIVVVTGHDGARVAAALAGLDLTIVANPDYADGLSTSLRAGLEALPSSIDGTLICLGDMPQVDTEVLSALTASFTGESAICVPVYRGRRGNPVLWGRRYFAEIMTLSGDAGARPLLARHREHVVEVEVASDGIFADVDTPADLARLTLSNG
jgi:molybdenum cofactor cytidylyltransferase